MNNLSFSLFFWSPENLLAEFLPERDFNDDVAVQHLLPNCLPLPPPPLSLSLLSHCLSPPATSQLFKRSSRLTANRETDHVITFFQEQMNSRRINETVSQLIDFFIDLLLPWYYYWSLITLASITLASWLIISNLQRSSQFRHL